MIIFITGGAKSGKSEYAVLKAKALKKDVTFIATCVFPDKEMLEKIEKHKKTRPSSWIVIEEGIDLKKAIDKVKTDVVIIDCLTIWLANIMEKKMDIEKISKELFKALNLNKTIIVVSNETGCGIVPKNRAARRFRDIIGVINKGISKIADEVYLMVAGIPVKIKGG